MTQMLALVVWFVVRVGQYGKFDSTWKHEICVVSIPAKYGQCLH